MRVSGRRLQFVLLTMLTLAAWSPVVGGRFQFDDLPNIVLDRATSDPAALVSRLANGFRPLLRLSYAGDYFLWGFAPAGFLATNLLIHLATVVIVWRLAIGRTADPLAAFLGASVFTLQPAHAAVVAWASGRSTGLSTLLLAGALLAHERGVLDTRRRWSAASLALMCLAVSTKETALAFPAIVLLWEATRDPRPARSEIFRRVTPSALAAGAAFAFMLCVSARLRDLLLFSRDLGSPAQALATHLSAVPVSLSLWFRPWALTVEHPLPALGPLAGAAALAALAGVAAWSVPRRPLLALACLWPLVILLPSHSVIARLDPIVEKPLYGAWIGPSLAAGAALAWALRSRFRVAAGSIVVAAALVLLVTANWRARVWADPARLWREASEAAPLSARAWSNRAAAALESGEPPAAVEHYLARARLLTARPSQLDDLELALRVVRSADQEAIPR